MDFDWKEVGHIIGPLAPTLGGILGGVLLPGLGGTIGTQAGEILASALGVDPTPEAVGKAITEDPNAVAKIQAAEQEASAKWAALSQIAQAQFAGNTAQSQEMQMTIRAEVAAGQKPWAWRNVYGYSVTVEVAGVFMLFFVSILFMPDVFTRLMSASTWLTGWFTLRFTLLGYIHNQATTEKVAAATGQAPEGMIQSIVKAVKSN
jgi:hypothetical protein